MKKVHIKFPRDLDGHVDPVNGNYSKERPSTLNVKYEKEIRMSLGCLVREANPADNPADIVNYNGRQLVGVRLEPFDYSGKVIVTIKDYQKHMDAEISRVKKLTKRSEWKYDPRPANAIFMDDSMDVINGIGAKTVEKLKGINILTVGQMRSNIAEKGTHRIHELSQVPKSIIEKCNEAINNHYVDENKPPLIDHTREENPYLSRYGGEWKERIKQTHSMSPYVCVTDLILHMVRVCDDFFKDTIHRDSWVFYHDALTLMTARETKSWMESTGLLRRWLLPENNLHSDDNSLSHYRNRPVGDSPELMPWDTSLNQDVHLSVERHIQATKDLLDEDAKKFSISTPKRGASAYIRVLQGCPSSKRIVQDTLKVRRSIDAIIHAEGIAVENLGNRSGIRKQLSQKDMRGGYHPKKATHEDNKTWMHEHANECMQNQIKQRLEANNSGCNEGI